MLTKLLTILLLVLAGFLFYASRQANTIQADLSTSSVTPSVSQQAINPGLKNIKHIIIIMQENRSFDHYFGTYPGADGLANIPASTCIRNPATGHCVSPFLTTADRNIGGTHSFQAFNADVNKGKMDGYLQMRCGINPNSSGCSDDSADVMSYHDRSTIPNYWSYADNFVLQDRMFEPSKSNSIGEHLFLVSGWSATCTNRQDPMSCKTELSNPDYLNPWTDITYLLYKNKVSWGYYLDKGLTPSCGDNTINMGEGAGTIDTSENRVCASQSNVVAGGWNPLPGFLTVKNDNQLGNIRALGSFFTSLQNGTLPSVVWIVPNLADSEHPPALVSDGQRYVTTIINQVMKSSYWNDSAILLSWDDWGGFYDHVMPPRLDPAGFGLRVPGLLISAYAKQGYIDHQTLSHDSYMKFIEDVFLNGQRINPRTDGRPDSRPFVRENSAAVGDLSSDFDFTQAPRPPLILPQ